MKEIQYSKNVVGCNIKGEIYVHPELYKYPELYKAVVLHEKGHTDSFGMKDVALDIVNEELKGNKKQFYKFILTHPRTLLGFFPITKVGKHWAFDAEMAVAWILTIAFVTFLAMNI